MRLGKVFYDIQLKILLQTLIKNAFFRFSNLNGKYFTTAVVNPKSVYWDNLESLKQVRMLIRPKVIESN